MSLFSKKDLKRKITIPKNYSNDLAELLGILTGDGYITHYRKYNYIIEVAGNKIKDKEYLFNYVFNLFIKLFNIKPNKIKKKNQNTIYIRALSKRIFIYLVELGFKKGRKGEIGIPFWIKENKNFSLAFIKGLLDTDGCLCFKKKEGKLYPVISISSASFTLLNNVKKIIKALNIASYLGKESRKNSCYKKRIVSYKLQINGINNCRKWIKKIGSNNKRNLEMFSRFYQLYGGTGSRTPAP